MSCNDREIDGVLAEKRMKRRKKSDRLYAALVLCRREKRCEIALNYGSGHVM